MPTDLPNERALRKPGTLELDPAGEGIAIDESPRLIASNKVEGTAVYDSSGRHLGAVHNFMVDKVSGQVAYVVLAFGGFLGLGETHHPLPWKALTYSTEFGGYVIDIDPAVLAGASSSGAGEDEVADPSYRARI
ncbi:MULTISPECIES: PRC-barrel domain-containing protein [Methylobacterium]|jgi:hypothetical protein|uniref:PRC-barrel domain-containing protein n=1 Tax=Methylobacterium fujisawaense TaxID=107400 RepID=A0ABR6DGH0_9HYPH|nr:MULTISPECIES: PRC-barrel domain-containing protein [Methylobacterium]MBA9065205.1 hypothetical protein [Methylobacterium fujisawaense]MBP28680.1 photosystem reaction center subunit H [Methylobacterium sp.]MDE4911910.1 PRC-barrel domain-containing protein [Methylobacterium sp. 092160098-2]MDH3028834.1 PRC-barrel domain-containing protein [Methylobacterium fujisawaense]WFS05776.1 PRC-barrel domain-containing protein [Methylobacterium sp. 391_Methyba4]